MRRLLRAPPVGRHAGRAARPVRRRAGRRRLPGGARRLSGPGRIAEHPPRGRRRHGETAADAGPAGHPRRRGRQHVATVFPPPAREQHLRALRPPQQLRRLPRPVAARPDRVRRGLPADRRPELANPAGRLLRPPRWRGVVADAQPRRDAGSRAGRTWRRSVTLAAHPPHSPDRHVRRDAAARRSGVRSLAEWSADDRNGQGI